MIETAAAALRRAAARLHAAGIEAPAREARLLLLHAQGAPANALPDPAAPAPSGFTALVERRAAREPFARIVGRQGFWTLDLALSPATLIPRADSETLIEALRDGFAHGQAPARILDLGTGTGALLLAALAIYPMAVGVGVDKSAEAAATAAANADAVRLEGRAMFLVGDWGDAIAGQFDAVLVNPPYIRSGDIARLMPEVTHHEPHLALDGGPDGLDAYRRLVPSLKSLLRQGGIAILEIGAGQETSVAAIGMEAGFAASAARRDLGGNPRALPLRLVGDGRGVEKAFGSAAIRR